MQEQNAGLNRQQGHLICIFKQQQAVAAAEMPAIMAEIFKYLNLQQKLCHLLELHKGY